MPTSLLRPVPLFELGLALVLASGCTGTFESAGTKGGLPGADGGLGSMVGGCKVDIGVTPLLRLTRAQMDNAATDLLSSTFRPSAVLGTDETVGPFASNGQVLMSSSLAQLYQFVAEQLGAEVEANALAHAPCADTVHGAAACGAAFVDQFGRRAFRRPLTAEERQRWNAVFVAALADSYAGAVRTVVEGILQSPSFLYRTEPLPSGTAASTTQPYTLDAFARASRLSFLLWNSGPDDALLDAAASGALDTPAGQAAQLARMSKDSRHLRAMDAFTGGWADLDQLAAAASTPARLGTLSPTLIPLMRSETVAFVDDVLTRGDGKLTTLLSAPYTVADPSLAKAIYGTTATPDSAGHIPLDPAQRSGVLTQASLLFTHAHAQVTSPTLRGKWVREVLLCQDVPPPPPNVNTAPPIPVAGQTMRQRLAAHRTDPSCSGCHGLMDDIGLGFESFDQYGQYRALEVGLPVDSSGNLVGSDVDGTFPNAVGLGSKLASSSMAQSCFARQWFRFGLGRDDTHSDDCSLQSLGAAMSHGGYPAFLQALVQSPAFSMRRSP